MPIIITIQQALYIKKQELHLYIPLKRSDDKAFSIAKQLL